MFAACCSSSLKSVSPLLRNAHRQAFTQPACQARSRPIRKVTVAGTTGAIGGAVIAALKQAGFDVQALSRMTRTPAFDVVRRVDYTNKSQLQAVLEGQDAVVSCLGDTPSAVAAQEALLDASISAGVTRFVPSEYGCDTSNDYVRTLPFFAAKIRHQKMLQAAALGHHDFTYTILITGLFLDWCLSTVPCTIDCGSRTAQVYDDGNLPFSATRTAVVAQAVSAILQQPDQTRNKTLRIHELVITQNELIERAQCLTRHLGAFSCMPVNTTIYESHAWRAYAKARADPLEWMVPFINLSIWSKGLPGRFKHVDNALLGVSELRGARRQDVIDNELRTAMHTLSTLDIAQQAYEDGKQRLVAC